MGHDLIVDLALLSGMEWSEKFFPTWLILDFCVTESSKLMHS